MYDSSESDLKLNVVFEFIVVLTFDTELKTDADEVTELNNSLYEEELTHLPPSKVLIDSKLPNVSRFLFALSTFLIK
mgnify:FL=1